MCSTASAKAVVKYLQHRHHSSHMQQQRSSTSETIKARSTASSTYQVSWPLTDCLAGTRVCLHSHGSKLAMHTAATEILNMNGTPQWQAEQLRLASSCAMYSQHTPSPRGIMSHAAHPAIQPPSRT